MDAILMPSSSDQSISPYKQQQIRNPKKNTRHFISRPSENLAPPKINHGGILFTPPPPPSLSFSLPPSQQPPLLPLPITKPYNSLNSLPPRTRGLSCSPTSRKFNKKSKPSNSPVKEDTKQVLKSSASPREVSGCLVIASTNRLGPDPEDLPKDVSRVFSGNSVIMTGVMGDLEKFSGSVFTLSPPPSSLPLPKFSLRPTKLSCNAEAAGIDAGATDNLRRLLRLR
ncbi:hypothetical protein L1049_025801 [Liquidambar formosana]|uniref:Uncharacterized protein n=1 Tax=Liquidambar formosana TaxID=63359 RepID=A0AAP0R6P2_LIQFO